MSKITIKRSGNSLLNPTLEGRRVAEEILTEIAANHLIVEGGSKAFLDAKKQLKAVGMHLHHDREWEQYRVVPHKDRANKDLGYFTDDLEDALATGHSIAKKTGLAADHDAEVRQAQKYGLASEGRDYGDEPGPYDEDRSEFQDPGGKSALRRATRSNPRIHPCPTCKAPNRLTPKDKRLGYQCDQCADRDEGGFGY